MRVTRAVLPVMQSSGAGAVVTVASEASLGAGAAGVAYATSKHGIIGLVRHVAFFYGPAGIRSNAVLPGGVETGIGSTAEPRSGWAMERAQLKMATMGPMADPDQIATAVSWLAPQPPVGPCYPYINDPGVVSSSPVSSQVFNPERIIGQPP